MVTAKKPASLTRFQEKADPRYRKTKKLIDEGQKMQDKESIFHTVEGYDERVKNKEIHDAAESKYKKEVGKDRRKTVRIDTKPSQVTTKKITSVKKSELVKALMDSGFTQSAYDLHTWDTKDNVTKSMETYLIKTDHRIDADKHHANWEQ